MLIDILYLSPCGKYIAIMRDCVFSEYIQTNKPGRQVGYNQLCSEWIKLEEWSVERLISKSEID